MQVISKIQILKFLEDYCYAIYLGVFGAYLFGWLGLILFGMWGLWNDKRIIKKKVAIFSTKKTIIESTKLYSVFQSFKNIKLYPYLIYMVWAIIIIIVGFVIGGIIQSSILIDAVTQQNLSNLPEKGASVSSFIKVPSVILKISYLVPFVSEYLRHMKNNGMEDHMLFDTAIISAIWILCILKSPKLFQYFEEYFPDFRKLAHNTQIILISIFSLAFLVAISLVFIENTFLIPKSREGIKKIFLAIMILVPTTWILFSIVIGMAKSIYKSS